MLAVASAGINHDLFVTYLDTKRMERQANPTARGFGEWTKGPFMFQDRIWSCHVNDGETRPHCSISVTLKTSFTNLHV